MQTRKLAPRVSPAPDPSSDLDARLRVLATCSALRDETFSFFL